MQVVVKNHHISCLVETIEKPRLEALKQAIKEIANHDDFIQSINRVDINLKRNETHIGYTFEEDGEGGCESTVSRMFKSDTLKTIVNKYKTNNTKYQDTVATIYF